MGDDTMRVVSSRGYIKTLLGRRRRFNLFGPPKWSAGIQPLPYEQALKEFGAPVKRYFVHKAMNALIQGSSADMNKLAMLGCFEEGWVPHIPIHDELDFSIESMAQAKRIKEIMVNCVKLEVPLKVDVEIGPSWGEAKEVEL
jgi:DNA polymerase I-like protein with 3'-5' exonuclease and polymerase domains